VIGHLVNTSSFCKACDLACNYCRNAYGSFASDISGVRKLQIPSSPFIEGPSEFLQSIPQCDILIPIGLHPDILATIPSLAQKSYVKAVIVPIEDRRWCLPGLREELRHELARLGIDSAFPKPFCSLAPTGASMVDAFVERYRIGRPLLEIDLRGKLIANTHVLRSAPCGSTWFVAQQLKWMDVESHEAIRQAVSNAHHRYPCTASMEVDPELGDTILHESGKIIWRAVAMALDQVHRPILRAARA
jgi:hypothetical protein